mgnify:CR=1 FL=1
MDECPDCASMNVVNSRMREQIICRDCGLIFEPFKEGINLGPIEERTVLSKREPKKKVVAKKKKPVSKKVVKKKPAKKKTKPAKKTVKKKSAKKRR